jgi:tripartite-type tricarboxylate transporter receptor subunit TctC
MADVEMMTGTSMLHVPYKGGPQAMTDLMAGHVAASFATAPSAMPNVKGGRVRALGVSATTRVPAPYAALIRDEVGQWAKVVKASGSKVDQG